MKFGQLLEYNVRNIFLQNHTKNVVKNYSQTRPFSEKLKLNVSLDQQFKIFLRFAFIVCQVEGYQNMLKLTSKPLAFTTYKTF